MPRTQPTSTDRRVEAYFASALHVLGWLFGAILRGGWPGRGKRLKHLLSRLEHAVECILFLKAASLFGPAPPKRTRRPYSAPPGFRRVVGCRHFFFKRVGIRAGRRAGPLARVRALIEALTSPGAAVAHFVKCIRAGLRRQRLIPIAPPGHAPPRETPPAPCNAIDSS
ncbi:MAG: hypothetical protein AB7T59_03955 [Hyphomonadaceae bacterium]